MSTYGTPPVDYRNPAAPEAVCECDNCGHLCASHELGPVHDPDERIDEDGPEPEGECPECGCLSYVVADDAGLQRTLARRAVPAPLHQ